MKRKLTVILATCFVLSATVISAAACQSKDLSKTNSAAASSETTKSLAAGNKDNPSETNSQISDSNTSNSQDNNSTNASDENVGNSTKTVENSANNSSAKIPASRGGNAVPSNIPTAQSKTIVQAKPQSQNISSKSKVELLDWWKDAQYVFPRGASAIVQDYYTGKTFNIVRTMGTNHADCEAASKADTDIIKSIWGGFTWTRRPVIVIINGRRLAASMSAMPHAGIDALPAYQTVDNRSDGYGTGQNLDVIKGNGMDGHFDIHFLNSTRHKDNQIDPQHQAMIKIAAGL